MKILFISYINFRPSQFGASVRPQKMYKAFLDEGHEVKLLAVGQNRSEWPRRRRAVREIMQWLDTNTPDLCYIESHVYPILLPCDYRLIRRLHRMGVPTGYFYRDFYWKFPDVYQRRTDFVGRLKEAWISFLQSRTDHVLKYVDIVYLPSEPAKELFSYRDMRSLPPAGENRLEGNRPEERTCIYVGGIKGIYGGAQLLEAFHILNAGEDTYRLILVCREKEWAALQSPYKEALWLEVHHASGEELIPLYRRSALAMGLFAPASYHRYTVSVKLYEYMSYGLPMVVSGAPEMERLTRESGTGLAIAYGAENAAAAVRQFFADEKLRNTLCEQTAQALLNNNLWIHRARQVVADLTNR